MISQLPIPGLELATKVSSAMTAMVMPIAERRLPLRAEAGEFIWCRPIANNEAPNRKATCTRYPRSVVFMAGS